MMNDGGNDIGAPNVGAIPMPADTCFVLLTGDAELRASSEAFIDLVRRFGFRPVTVPGAPSAMIDGAPLQLSFGPFQVRTGPASDAAIAAMNPDQSGVIMASGPLPDDWSARAIAFVPDLGNAGVPVGVVARLPERRFFEMLGVLIDMLGASHFCWSPARLWTTADAFRTAVAEMLESGMPPVLHLIAFGQLGGGAAEMRTRGLAHFSGQELVANPPAHWDRREVVRRLARLALDMMINGAIDRPRCFAGLVPGEEMRVEPDPVDPTTLCVKWRFDVID